MRRKDQSPGKSLISTRTNQHQQQQRNMPNTRSYLPRSYSTPATQKDSCLNPQISQKGYVMRSFSSPEPKRLDYRRNSDSFYRPKTHGSRTELDMDLENFENFEEGFLDIDAEQELMFTPVRRGSVIEEPRRVMASLLPGSGIQKVSVRPISSATTQTLQGARDAMRQMQKEKTNQGFSRLNFRPLTLKMPTTRSTMQQPEPSSPVAEELQRSPEFELESQELEREMDNAEQHLHRGVAMATEESDTETVSVEDKIVFCKPINQ